MVAREVEAANQPAYYRFLFRRENERGVAVGERILTKQGGISRTLAVNGKTPTQEQTRQWEQGAQKLLGDRDLQERRRKSLQQEQDRITRLIRALPEAFLYESDGHEAENGWIRLKFRPNPEFEPKSSETRAFRGMEGVLWVDPASERLAKFQGKLSRDVDFGWGILGKLYRGGQILMENKQLPDGRWATVALTLQLTGRLFIVKSFSVDQKDRFTEFQKLPESFTLSQAVEQLQKARLTACGNHRPPDGFCLAE